MADEKIGIEIQVTTAAAVAETKKLTGAIVESTTAAQGAGTEQKKLGRSVAETKAAQIEATEAIRRAKDAQAEHNLVIQAHGPKSREAAESAKKLAAAQDEAKRATLGAAKALESVTKEAQAAAQAEGEKLSPATRRAAAQLSDMAKQADRAAGDLRKMELQTAKAGKELQNYEGFARGAGRGLGELKKAGAGDWQAKQVGLLEKLKGFGPALLAGAGAVAGVAALASGLAEAAKGTLQFETAMANLPFSLDGAKKATRGLIDEQTLLAAASSATSLKVTKTSGEFETLAAASVKLAAKLGQPADQLLGNLVTALGRGSTELLDNAGIVLKTGEAQERYAKSIGTTVDALTDEQKAAAFKTEAFKAIVAAADQTTIAVDSNAAAIIRFENRASDAWGAIERAAVNAAGSVLLAVEDINTPLIEYAANAQAAAEITARWKDEAEDAPIGITEWAIATVRLSDAYQDLSANITAFANSDALKKAMEDQKKLGEEMAKEAAWAERQNKAYKKLLAEQEAHLDFQAEQSVVYGPAPMPKKEKKAKGKKKDPNQLKMDQMDFDSDVSTFAAKQNKEQGAAFAKEAEDRQKAAEKAFEAESEMREARLAGLDRELEAIEAKGVAETQQMDLIFWHLDMENEAEARRAELQDERIKREEQLARWQVKNAKSEEQRAKALTRVEEVEHRKRILSLQRANAAEAREQAKKVKLFETLNASMIQLGGTMLDAIEAQVQGEKGAIAEGVANFAKGVRNKMILKALEEYALGAAALAGIVTAGLAAPHFAAAGLATAAAVAAGGAQAGFHALAKKQSGGSDKGEVSASKLPSTGGSGGMGGIHNTGGSHSSSSSSGSDEVPTSYNDGMQHTGRMAKAQGGGGNVTINVLGGSAEQVGVALKKLDRNTLRSLGSSAARR